MLLLATFFPTSEGEDGETNDDIITVSVGITMYTVVLALVLELMLFYIYLEQNAICFPWLEN